jgi:glutaredoxin
LKEVLSKRGLAFTSKDVQEDPAAFKELVSLGARSTPTTVIEGEVVIGYDIDSVLEILGREIT